MLILSKLWVIESSTLLCKNAHAMTVKNIKYTDKSLIHHSDRGFQYCNPKYTTFADKIGIMMSMTEQYDPYENCGCRKN